MQKLDELGCPSVWFGYSGAASTNLFSPQMIALEDDTTFKNLVVSAMMNNLSPPQLRKLLRVGWLTFLSVWCSTFLFFSEINLTVCNRAFFKVLTIGKSGGTRC